MSNLSCEERIRQAKKIVDEILKENKDLNDEYWFAYLQDVSVALNNSLVLLKEQSEGYGEN